MKMLIYSFVFLVLLGLANAQTDPPTEPPSTAAPATDPPSTAAPATDPPSTAAPATDPPSTAGPATDPPSTAAPDTDATTDAPDTDPPATTSPPPDSLSVECSNEHMMVYLEHEKHPNIALDKVTLRDNDCKLNDLGSSNRTHLWMRVPFDSCMTNHTTNDDTIVYANSLITETRASAGAAIISREFQAEFPFKCTYPRSAVVSVASFSPREKVIYTKTAEFGNFTFTMDMYETDQYETPYDSYPVRMDLNDPMYLEVKVMSNDSQLVLIPEKCWSTPTDDINDANYYNFIENGCKNEDDPTLVWNYEEDSVQRFQMGVFRFLSASADATVYLHCEVEACREGDSESRCAKGCEDNGSRKRRSLVLDALAKQSVTIGPVRATKRAKVEQGQRSASSLTVIAAVAGVLAVVVLALTVALVMLYKRYRSPQNPARVVYTKASNDDNKLLV